MENVLTKWRRSGAYEVHSLSLSLSLSLSHTHTHKSSTLLPLDFLTITLPYLRANIIYTPRSSTSTFIFALVLLLHFLYSLFSAAWSV
jgi:hypothetical protein